MNSQFVPKSMFTPDGKLLLGSDKSTIMHKIEDMIKPEEEEFTDPIKFEKVAVFDGDGDSQ